MKRIPLLLLFSLCALGLARDPARGDAATELSGGIFPYPRHEFRLDNGLSVVVLPCPSEGLVMDALIVDVGMRAERKPEEVEYTHLLEHLMFRGSVRHTAAEAGAILARAGAYEQGFTESDFTCYYRIFPAEYLDTMTVLLAGKFAGLAFTDEEYKAETGAVLGEYTGHCDSPESLVWNALYRTAFTVHPYRAVEPAAHLATLRAMPENRAGVMAFFERFYKPNNARLILCGAVDPATARAAVERAWGPLPPGEPVPAAPEEPPADGERRAALSGAPGSAPRLALAWRIPGYDPDAPDTAALALFAQMHLAAGSPLDTLLCEERALVSEIDWPGHFFARDPSLLAISLKLKDAADLPEVERLVVGHIDKLAGARPSRAKVESAKRKAKYRFLSDLDSLDNILFGFCKGYFLRPEPDATDRFFAALARLSPADLRAAARRAFRPENRVVVAYLPAPAPPAAGEPSDRKGGDGR